MDAILELGLADEDTLVAFLASKLMIPRVRSAVLERLDQHTLERVPALLAWDFKCMPVSFDEMGNLTVAMSDPTDERAIRAIAEQTNSYLVRAVASASDLRRALDRHYGAEHEVRERAAAQLSEGVNESARPTELNIEPSQSDQAPAPVAAPYMQVGVIPEDDDDVPVRGNHGAAEEVNSGPHEHAYEPAAAPVAAPPVAAPYVTAPPVAGRVAVARARGRPAQTGFAHQAGIPGAASRTRA
ncbi:hypothetical protein, partial [Enhygromyxa salina]|uniref:GspE/PulE/PilB domain-containing protein n=1 Tax=Enhygromyxa salina TaxID=215803 RepID=UPI0015E61355